MLAGVAEVLTYVIQVKEVLLDVANVLAYVIRVEEVLPDVIRAVEVLTD